MIKKKRGELVRVEAMRVVFVKPHHGGRSGVLIGMVTYD